MPIHHTIKSIFSLKKNVIKVKIVLHAQHTR